MSSLSLREQARADAASSPSFGALRVSPYSSGRYGTGGQRGGLFLEKRRRRLFQRWKKETPQVGFLHEKKGKLCASLAPHERRSSSSVCGRGLYRLSADLCLHVFSVAAAQVAFQNLCTCVAMLSVSARLSRSRAFPARAQSACLSIACLCIICVDVCWAVFA